MNELERTRLEEARKLHDDTMRLLGDLLHVHHLAAGLVRLDQRFAGVIAHLEDAVKVATAVADSVPITMLLPPPPDEEVRCHVITENGDCMACVIGATITLDAAS